IYQGMSGALGSEPETIDLPDAATALALGQLVSDGYNDLAIAAGTTMFMVPGWSEKRTRRLSQTGEVETHTFDANIGSNEIGHFTGRRRSDLALSLEDGSIHVLSRDPDGAPGRRGRLDRDVIQTG